MNVLESGCSISFISSMLRRKECCVPSLMESLSYPKRNLSASYQLVVRRRAELPDGSPHVRPVTVTTPLGGPAVGVRVTDGASIAVTDANGEARLAARGSFVSLINRVPGAATPWYADAAATEFRFVASSRPAADPVTFAHVTDLHVSHPESANYPRSWTVACHRVASELRTMEAPSSEAQATAFFESLPRLASDASFAVATGDLTNRATDAEFAAYRRASSASLPVVNVPGNHDHRFIDGQLDVSTYEHHLGPRWYSLDVGGLHLVVLDWFSWTIGEDADQQRCWLDADLAANDGRPWVLCVHDRIRDLDLAALEPPPVATVTGHWHASRVLEHQGTRHVATAPATFAGLDGSTPMLREITISQGALALKTVRAGETAATLTRQFSRRSQPKALDERAGWTIALPGSGTAGSPLIIDDTALVTTTDENEGVSFVTLLDLNSGAQRWRRQIDMPIRSTPAAHGSDVVVVVTTAGAVWALEAATGSLRWSHEGIDPLLTWMIRPPDIDDGLVVAGDVTGIVALDLVDGTTRWRRADLGEHINHVAYSGPILVDGRVITGFWPQAPGLIALSRNDGTVEWPEDLAETITGSAWGDGIPTAPRAQLVPDPDGRTFYIVEAGALVRRRARDGGEVWRAALPGLFASAPPTVTDRHVLTVEYGSTLRCVERESGADCWSVSLTDPAPLAVLPYSSQGRALVHAPAVVGDHAILALADGRLQRRRMVDGDLAGEVHLGSPLLRPPAVSNGLVVTIDLDGIVQAVPLAALADSGSTVLPSGVPA